MTVSKLASVNYDARKSRGPRNGRKIDKINIHHFAGKTTADIARRVLDARGFSANYLIGKDAEVAAHVDEEYAAICTSNYDVDMRGIAIEVSNDENGGQWRVSNAVLAKLIDLVEDICWRHDIYPCTYTGNKLGTLQMHRWYAATSCPGPYLAGKFKYIADTVTARLKARRTPTSTGTVRLWRVQVGAYKTSSYAYTQLAKVRNLYPEARILMQEGMHKVQVGAFSNYDNVKAIEKKLLKAGFKVYIKEIHTNAPSIDASKPRIVKGDTVKLKGSLLKDAKNGIELVYWLYGMELKVLNIIDGDIAQVSTDGRGISAHVRLNNLERIVK